MARFLKLCRNVVIKLATVYFGLYCGLFFFTWFCFLSSEEEEEEGGEENEEESEEFEDMLNSMRDVLVRTGEVWHLNPPLYSTNFYLFSYRLFSNIMKYSWLNTWPFLVTTFSICYLVAEQPMLERFWRARDAQRNGATTIKGRYFVLLVLAVNC